MEYKEIYQQTPDETKLNFPEALLSENKDLQEQFVRCVETAKDTDVAFSLNDFYRKAENNRSLYLSLFEAVDVILRHQPA